MKHCRTTKGEIFKLRKYGRTEVQNTSLRILDWEAIRLFGLAVIPVLQYMVLKYSEYYFGFEFNLGRFFHICIHGAYVWSDEEIVKTTLNSEYKCS
jgi:hypothetical protein